MNNKYGKLLTPDITLHRKYFNELVSLLGIQVLYRQPRPDKHWTVYGEIESNYFEPITVGCIFETHIDQKTMKKLGWNSELEDSEAVIHVAYDTPGIQVGALFTIPSGIDESSGRLYRVTKMYNSMIYPASITCIAVPELEDTFTQNSDAFKHDSLPLLNTEPSSDEAFVLVGEEDM